MTPSEPSDQPAGARDPATPSNSAPMNPGDQAPPGTPGTGEDVCPRCGGSGQFSGSACPDCGGSGRVIVGIGGA